MTSFALLIGLGASLGLWQVARTSPEKQTGSWVDAGLGVLVGMLFGARAVYVALHPAFYAAHPGEWYRLWLGGYSAAGAVAGGLVAALIAALLMRTSFALLLDAVSPLFPPLVVLGWLGCAAVGCGYGPEMGIDSWLAVPVPDEWGQVMARFPLQFSAALIFLVYNWVVAAVLTGRSFPGQRAALVGLGLAGVQFSAALLSAEPVALWRGLSYEAWAALGLGVFSLGLAVYAFWPRKKIKDSSPRRS